MTPKSTQSSRPAAKTAAAYETNESAKQFFNFPSISVTEWAMTLAAPTGANFAATEGQRDLKQWGGRVNGLNQAPPRSANGVRQFSSPPTHQSLCGTLVELAICAINAQHIRKKSCAIEGLGERSKLGNARQCRVARSSGRLGEDVGVDWGTRL